MSTFQRARSEEQRELRRRAILDAAAAMLDEMPVSELSLNELSRRVGLAKSNVLRYFESREAVLLELLNRAAMRWLEELSDLLPAGVGQGGTVAERGDQLATVLAESLARQRVLCDLLGAQAGVLEHNVSEAAVAGFKRAAVDFLAGLAELVRRQLPELGEAASRLCLWLAMMAGTIWTHTQPSDSALAAYQADPGLAVLRMDFTATFADMAATLIAGILARG